MGLGHKLEVGREASDSTPSGSRARTPIRALGRANPVYLQQMVAEVARHFKFSLAALEAPETGSTGSSCSTAPGTCACP